MLFIGYFEGLSSERGDCVAGGRFTEPAVVPGPGVDRGGAGSLDAAAHAAAGRRGDPRGGVHVDSGAAVGGGSGSGEDGGRRAKVAKMKDRGHTSHLRRMQSPTDPADRTGTIGVVARHAPAHRGTGCPGCSVREPAVGYAFVPRIRALLRSASTLFERAGLPTRLRPLVGRLSYVRLLVNPLPVARYISIHSKELPPPATF